jgi:uncharacterized membrane protein
VDRGRLEAFSDGVIAVAITLLVFDLTTAGPGHGSLLHQLGDRWPAFVAYLISFFTVGIVWVNHHAVVANIRVVDRLVMFLNLTLLVFVVLIPFGTATMAEYLRGGGTDAKVAVALYAVILLGMGLSFFAIFEWTLRHDRAVRKPPPEALRRARVIFGLGNLMYIAAVALAFLTPVGALGLTGVAAVYYIFERT